MNTLIPFNRNCQEHSSPTKPEPKMPPQGASPKKREKQQDPNKKYVGDAILSARQFCERELPQREQLLSPWLQEASIGLVSGWRGIGKTFLALGILKAISNGETFGSWECHKQTKCLFLDGEMPQQDIQKRLAYLDAHQNENLLIYSDARANELGLPRAHLAKESWRSEIKDVLLHFGVKFWVIDNIASLASGLDENSKEDWDPINQWLINLRFAGIATMLLHHVGKGGQQRGTSAREDNLDYSIALKYPHDYCPEDGARFVFHPEKMRVRHEDLPAISDVELRLQLNERGAYVWTWAGVKKENRRQTLILLDEGLDQNTVAETLGLSKGYVSKIKTQGVSDGHLTPKGKLTQSGFTFVYGGGE